MMKWKCGFIAGLSFLTVFAGFGLGSLQSTVRADEKGEPDAVAIDEKNFPDEVFRDYVSDFDKDNDGTLSKKERDAVKEIKVDGYEVASLEGTQYFENLISVSCNYTPISKIDVAKMPNVETLSLSDTQIKALDVSSLKNLDTLICNASPLKELNVNGCEELKYLDVSGSMLSKIDVTGVPDLQILAFYETSISEVDVSKNPYLAVLDCTSTQIKSLDISNNDLIQELYLAAAPISELDVSNCKYLTTLVCSETSIKTLDLSNHAYLENLDCVGCDIASLDLAGCDHLNFLICSSNPITALDVKGLTNLSLLAIEETQIEELDVSGLENLECVYGSASPITKFSANGCKNLQALEFIQCNLTSVDLRGCSGLQYLMIAENPDLETVDVSDCTELSSLTLAYNKLSSLTIGNLQKLKELEISGNMISELDVSGLESLDMLFCNDNQLKKLDVSKNKKMTLVTCDNNQIEELILPEDGKLIVVEAIGNKLSALDVSKCQALKVIYVAENNISSLDISNNPNLMIVATGHNPIKELDIRSNEALVNVVKNYARQTSEDGDSYFYTDMEEEKSLKKLDKKELKELCADPEGVVVFGHYIEYPKTAELIYVDPTPTPTPTPSPTPTPEPVKDPTIGDFVDRLYTQALGRASEESGKKYWVNEITNGRKTGGDCALFFLTGEEFANRKLSNEDFVETLYKTFFDRASEASGKSYWVGVLKNGGDRASVVKGFIDSKEWCNLCADYGVRSGAPNAKAERAGKKATEFVTRLYTCCLGREADQKGLSYWALALTNLEQTGASAAKEFFGSSEFANLKTSNEEYVTRLYKTFMDREPEATGFAYWVGQLKGGMSRNDVLAQFVVSKEFTNICAKYGIERGNV